jgi:hypothetical protein
MTVEPKPARDGAVTGGPPRSKLAETALDARRCAMKQNQDRFFAVWDPLLRLQVKAVNRLANVTPRIASSDNVTESGSTPRQGSRDPSR